MPKYQISFLHAYILTRLLFAAMKYLPSSFFSFTICSNSWVMWQQQKPQQSREEEEEQKVHWSVYCLWKQSITGTADFDNHIQEKLIPRSQSFLSFFSCISPEGLSKIFFGLLLFFHKFSVQALNLILFWGIFFFVCLLNQLGLTYKWFKHKLANVVSPRNR